MLPTNKTRRLFDSFTQARTMENGETVLHARTYTSAQMHCLKHKAYDCGPAPTYPNSKRTGTKTFASYICDSGYTTAAQASEVQISTCSFLGFWSKMEFKCVRMPVCKVLF